MDKTEQASDWSDPDLTESQLEYAYNDALETWDLFQHWYDRADQDHLKAWQMLDDMVPPVIEMEEAGMLLDTHRHDRLIGEWTRIQHKKVAEISETVGSDDVANIRSDAQWSDYFSRILPDHVVGSWPRTEKTGQLSMKGEVLRSVAAQFEVEHPGNPLTSLLDALAAYKKVSKYISSFGDSLLQKAHASPGSSAFAQGSTLQQRRPAGSPAAGPNLQQVPRDNELLGEATSVQLVVRRRRRLPSGQLRLFRYRAACAGLAGGGRPAPRGHGGGRRPRRGRRCHCRPPYRQDYAGR